MMFINMMIGVIGAAYLLYGWKQKRIVATVAGVALSVAPMVVPSLVAPILIATVVIPLPWFVRV
ncbi:MAG: hypothetical protein ACJAYU_003921 [Bradymonadia bacterium]|jgi:hypothetical protein